MPRDRAPERAGKRGGVVCCGVPDRNLAACYSYHHISLFRSLCSPATLHVRTEGYETPERSCTKGASPDQTAKAESLPSVEFSPRPPPEQDQEEERTAYFQRLLNPERLPELRTHHRASG